jgi:hypothetical protein
MDGYDPFGVVGQIYKDKLTEEQVGIILWSRRVFNHAQLKYREKSKMLAENKVIKFGKNVVDFNLDRCND